MKTHVTILAAVLCAGCSNSNDAKTDALSAKLDTVISNQSAILARLDTMPNALSTIGFYYYTNETSLLYFYHTNILTAMVGQEVSIEDAVNSETRRVGTIVFTNVAGFQADTLNTLNQIRLRIP